MVAKWGHVARTCQRAISGAPRLRRGLAFWIVPDLSGASPRPPASVQQRQSAELLLLCWSWVRPTEISSLFYKTIRVGF